MNYYNYFTEIEEHFVRRRGKHLLISPMDWALIAAWRDAGIPLQVALRGVDIAMDGFLARKGSGGSRVNSLCYCHDVVMMEFAAHLESHVGESSADAQAASEISKAPSDKKDELDANAILEFLSARISEIKALAAKQYWGEAIEGIHRVLARLEEIYGNVKSGNQVDFIGLERDLGMIDELLMTELKGAILPAQSLEWEKEAKKELRLYRKRLPKETYGKIRDNFMHDKIRREFNVGELSLFRL